MAGQDGRSRRYFRPVIAALSAVFAGLAFTPSAQAGAREAAVSALFDRIAGDPLRLRIFLRAMPKGGDLHNHLGGAVYAEDFLAWAREAGFCATENGLGLAPPPCPSGRSLDMGKGDDATDANRLINALSTRGYQQGIGRNEASGHNQFFQTFNRFGPIASQSNAKMLAAARRIAAGDHVGYLELDHDTNILSDHIGATPDAPLDEAGLARRYVQEIAAIGPLLDKAAAELDRDEANARGMMGCDGPSPEPACAVQVRYLFQGFRALPPAMVFRSLILGFAMADRDPRYVGVNIVMPEDAPLALRDYDLHMAMFRFLAAKYPKVRQTLHAGELAFGLVPPADLRDHIAKAIDAGAKRIGHGTGIAYEQDARATMEHMAREGIAVEINLTSNDVILGIRGDQHPLRLYRDMGVPVVLSTDDQGVLRTDMTNEYVRAAREHGLHYADLKNVARASLEYAFLPGASLWRDRRFGSMAAPCAGSFGSAACRTFLDSNEKARLQADLEIRFDGFEQAALAAGESPAIAAIPSGDMAAPSGKTSASR